MSGESIAQRLGLELALLGLAPGAEDPAEDQKDGQKKGTSRSDVAPEAGA